MNRTVIFDITSKVPETHTTDDISQGVKQGNGGASNPNARAVKPGKSPPAQLYPMCPRALI